MTDANEIIAEWERLEKLSYPGDIEIKGRDSRLAVFCFQNFGALVNEVERLRANLNLFDEAIQNSELDISPCMKCNKSVVCVPDGMPCCYACAVIEGSL